MRTGRELIAASKAFTGENRVRSWYELLSTLLLTGAALVLVFQEGLPFILRMLISFVTGLLYVRLFVIYHDYQHRAILQGSSLANLIMNTTGAYLLAPEQIWKRSHEHHHNNNSKLTLSGIGSYPTISKSRFLRLSKKDQRLYLINRHPITVFLGYITLFIYWLNLKSFIQSPRKHIDSMFSLLFHFGTAVAIGYYLGPVTLLLGWIFPFFLMSAIGSYVFYSQHNFPSARFRENHDWKYDEAALSSTSFMRMNPVMHWFTGNIGYHHVHHLNSRIPFYRLTEAMQSMPELNQVATTSWNPAEIVRCLRLKLWDPEKGKMISLSQL